MDASQLIEWSAEHRIVERTESGFLRYLHEWKKTNRADYIDTFMGELDTQLCTTKMKSIQLTHHYELSYDVVYCNLFILYIGERIGEYRMIFTLDGEVEDERLQLDRTSKETIRDGSIKLWMIRNARTAGLSINAIAQVMELEENMITLLSE
ncbi:hypothetical protein PaecuDRAFT_1019 [Paenibacillus curdlanolyticus YK9]|uniref:Uncharacterized protein n=1 Tax=Paenibacillus curdlanolyticus YK9 TaxID=717606 RepID=E0I5U7_9BACL|nr:hypothetical protein [Paenibacillus curdlanolyticus]EFM12339.1 hypothetical protein PaecuDRAFT_1019 [Paenibacillus curdlanolyticus YK9]